MTTFTPAWNELLARPPEKAHMVQLYSDPAVLRDTVSYYLSDGFRRGESAAVIATQDHWDEFRKGLQERGHDSERLEREGRLAVRDARTTLDSFMSHGMPDECLFHRAVGPVLSALAAELSPTIRAYGEMVSLLWNERRFDAALRLEELWNGLLEERRNFTLLCAYEGNVLAPEFSGRSFQSVTETHSHIVPAHDYERLSRAIQQAMEDVLGMAEAEALRPLIVATKRRMSALPGAQATLLWLQSNLPDRVAPVLAAARRRTAHDRG